MEGSFYAMKEDVLPRRYATRNDYIFVIAGQAWQSVIHFNSHFRIYKMFSAKTIFW